MVLTGEQKRTVADFLTFQEVHEKPIFSTSLIQIPADLQFPKIKEIVQIKRSASLSVTGHSNPFKCCQTFVMNATIWL